MATLLTELRRSRPIGVVGLAIGALVGALIYVVFPHRNAVDLAFVVDSQRPSASGAAALAGLLGDGGDRSYSPDFYAYLVSSDEVLYRIACRLNGTNAEKCDGGEIDRVALARNVARLKKRISANVARSTGVVTVRVIAESDSLAVTTGHAVLSTLDSFNRAIRRSRAGEEVRVASRLRDSVRAELAAAEEAVRGFLEKNRETGAPRLRLEQQRLERRSDLVNQVYMALARDAQEAELKLSRDTPVITVLQLPSLPARQVSPPPLMKLLLTTAFLGAFVGLFYSIAYPRLRSLWLGDGAAKGPATRFAS